MNDYELVIASRRNLDDAANSLSYLRDRHPIIYSELYEVFLILQQRQLTLEAMVAPEQQEKFSGFWIPFMIAAGVATVVGGTGFLFGKQKEETEKYKAYTDCLKDMTANFEAGGYGSAEAAERAAEICTGQTGGILEKIKETTVSFFENIGGAANIMPIVILCSAAFAIWYFFFKK